MTGQKEKISSKGSLEKSIKESNIDNQILSLNNLIERIDLLAKNENPYAVSREIEEIKSIFYIKLKEEKEKQINTKELGEQQENTEKALHPQEIKFKYVFNNYRKIKSDFRKKKEKEERNNLQIKKKIIADIDALSKEEESIKTTFEKFRALQEKWKKTGYVPITENNHLWQSYHHHVELFYDFIKLNNDLRDLDFKRNLEEKTAIYEKAIALLKETSINKAHDQLQELHEHWKNVGPVERKKREPIWEKFQEISREINKKRNDYFIKKKKEDSERLEKKNGICKKINNLTSKKINSHKEWEEATSQCHLLEADWKSIGRLNKQNNKIAWSILRESLTKFYNTKKTFYKQKKERNKQILENKLAICKKAERLQDSTNWKKSTKEFIKLQEEWKNSEFSAGNQANEIWERFRAACNIFFNAKKAHYKKIKNEDEEIYKKKRKVIKEIEDFVILSESEENITKLKEIALKWKKIGPNNREKKDLRDTFLNLLNNKFEKLGLSKKELAAEQYRNKINLLQGDSEAINSEQRIIRKKIDDLKKKITQYENNLSFFSSGKATQLLLKETQQKINNSNTEIDELKQKIQLLNKI